MIARIALFTEAYIRLFSHDLFMAKHDFAALHRQIKAFPLRRISHGTHNIELVRNALNVACSFYPKQALCLQRSAVLVKMLRVRGIPAQMVIGTQKMPFKAHAWVEADGHVIDDRLASRGEFFIMEIC
jgi:hypothetical protein